MKSHKTCTLLPLDDRLVHLGGKYIRVFVVVDHHMRLAKHVVVVHAGVGVATTEGGVAHRARTAAGASHGVAFEFHVRGGAAHSKHFGHLSVWRHVEVHR